MPKDSSSYDDADESEQSKKTDKPRNWARISKSRQVKAAESAWSEIDQAYENIEEYAIHIEDNWNIYNTLLDENQGYFGISRIYIPAVRDCVIARARRVLGQAFPPGHRRIEAISSDGRSPQATASLLEDYIEKSQLRTKVGSMLVQGYITGQLNLYVDWSKTWTRTTKIVESRGELDDAGFPDPTDTYGDVEEEFITEEMPDIWVPATTDIAVIPESVDSLKEASIVCIRHRMSKARIEDMCDRGLLVGASTDELLEHMEVRPRDQNKKLIEDLGIQIEGKQKFGWIYEAHLRMKLDHPEKEPTICWYRADGKVLGIQANPTWRKRLPLLCVPVEKLNGVFRGKSQIDSVRTLQWQINDMTNIGQDAAMYSVQPVVMTDPEKNPQYQSMMLSMAAIWPVDPNSTKILQFPDIYAQAWGIVSTLKAQVRESMGISEYELSQMPQGRKTNAQTGAIAQETGQASTDEAKDLEELILNPLLELMFELDTQYREKDRTVLIKGEVGIQARMEQVPPQQFTEKYMFWWLGTEFVNSIARIQQQIATMNVLRAIPPQVMQGKQIDISPILENIVQTVFDSRLAPKIIVDQRDQLVLDPELENEMLWNGMEVCVRVLDNDVLHLQSHAEAANRSKDPTGAYRAHMLKHLTQLQAKTQAAAPPGGMQMAAGEPGVPGGAGPGVAGTPRIGAQPGNVRSLQRPPGAIHQDAMVSPDVMSRG